VDKSDLEFLCHDIAIDEYIFQKDDGLYDAMNIGIRTAKSEYLLFLNSGDILLMGSEKWVETALKSGCDLICYNYVENAFGNKIAKKCKGQRKYELPTIHQAIIFRKRDIFYDTRLKIAADLKFYLDYRSYGASFLHLDFALTEFSKGGLSYVLRKVGLIENFRVRSEYSMPLLMNCWLLVLQRMKTFIKWKILLRNEIID
jgi:glycosyltransferase involved in cell wall biosynthesis